MARIRCPNILCRSTDVSLIGGKTRTGINLNPLHPFAFATTRASGPQKFHCNRFGKVFKVRI